MSDGLQQLVEFILDIDGSYEADSIPSFTVAIPVLDELLEIDSKTVARQIDKLLDISAYLLQHPQQATLLEIAQLYDFEVGVVVKYPKLAAKKNRGERLLRQAIEILSKIEDAVSDEWMNPADGLTDEDLFEIDADMQVSRQIMSSFDHLSAVLVKTGELKLFEAVFTEQVQRSDDWRIQFAAIIAASQLGEVFEEVDQLAVFIEAAMHCLTHYHPKVRYASLQLLGQLSDDQGPQFEEKYFDVLMPKLLVCITDPVPRVVSHTFACLTNFFEHFDEIWRIEGCLGTLLGAIFNFLKPGTSNSWLKENCVSALSSLAETKNVFGPQLSEVLEVANKLITENSDQPKYRQLLNQSFELISFLLSSQPKIYVQQYIQPFTTLLLAHKDKIDVDYFLSAWMRICRQYTSFVDISTVYPCLFAMVEQTMTEESDEWILMGLNCLQDTFRSFKAHMLPYLTQTLDLAKAGLSNNTASDDNREQCVKLITLAVKIINLDQPSPDMEAAILNSLQYLVTCTENTFSSEVACFEQLEWYYNGIGELIEDLPPHTRTNFVGALCNSMSPHLALIATRYKSAYEKKEHPEEDQDEELGQDGTEELIAKEDLRNLGLAMEAIPNLYGRLLKLNDNAINSQLIPYLLQLVEHHLVNEIEDWRYFALSLMVTIVESCTFQDVQTFLAKVLELLSQYTADPHTRFRNASIYGLGVVISMTPLEAINAQNITGWLQLLWAAMMTSYNTEDKGSISHSKDNVVSALGKLLQKFGPSFPQILNKEIYRRWFSYLPLNTDKEEGNIQQLFLIRLLDTSPDILVANAADLKKICECYAKFVVKRKKEEYREVVDATRQSLKRLKEWTLFQQSADYLWNSLTQSQLSTLTQLVNGD